MNDWSLAARLVAVICLLAMLFVPLLRRLQRRTEASLRARPAK